MVELLKMSVCLILNCRSVVLSHHSHDDSLIEPQQLPPLSAATIVEKKNKNFEAFRAAQLQKYSNKICRK